VPEVGWVLDLTPDDSRHALVRRRLGWVRIDTWQSGFDSGRGYPVRPNFGRSVFVTQSQPHNSIIFDKIDLKLRVEVPWIVSSSSPG
jgi:hypothetical protein